MPNRVVVQWDKDMLETAGMVKIDILGLRMLSAISEAVGIIEQTSGQRLTFFVVRLINIRRTSYGH